MSNASQPSALPTYLRIVRRRAWIIIAGIVVGLGSALAFGVTQGKLYTATATVLVEPTTTSLTLNNALPGTVSSQLVATDLQLVTSKPVKDALIRHLGNAPKVVTSASSTTNLITISYTSESPKEAARVANSYATAFVQYEKKTATDNAQAAVETIQGQITRLQSDATSLENRLGPSTNGQSAQTDALQAELTAFNSQITILEGELAQSEIDASLSTGGVILASAATPPTAPSSPRWKRTLAEGLGGGLVVGLAFAFLVDSLDDSIRSKDELNALLPDMPVLGVIPHIDAWKLRDRPYLVSLTAPGSPADESYRALRTAIEFRRIDGRLRSIVISSAIAGEGKTSTVANLAVAAARAGLTVLAVSADLRRPRLGAFFLKEDTVGITSLALGEATIEQAVQEVEQVPGLSYLGTGALLAGPSEVLDSRSVLDLLSSLEDVYDLVLIDTPPILPATDAIVVAREVGAMALVVSEGTTRRRWLARIMELCDQSNIQVIGCILTAATETAKSMYGYTYDESAGSYPHQRRRHSPSVFTRTAAAAGGSARGDNGHSR